MGNPGLDLQRRRSSGSLAGRRTENRGLLLLGASEHRMDRILLLERTMGACKFICNLSIPGIVRHLELEVSQGLWRRTMRKVIKPGSRIKDRTGKRYGKLIVLSFAGVSSYRNALWKVQCDCGKVRIVLGGHLHSGRTTSCGCARVRIKHGATRAGRPTREYESWRHMKKRCFNRNNHKFKNYGGRGISVCERWRNSFNNFLEDMGTCPPAHSIDRIDNNKDYMPGNCRWATGKEQNRNSRRNRLLTADGTTHFIA